jgi:hypothetical protein
VCVCVFYLFDSVLYSASASLCCWFEHVFASIVANDGTIVVLCGMFSLHAFNNCVIFFLFFSLSGLRDSLLVYTIVEIL